MVYVIFWAAWCHVCLRGYKNTEVIRKELQAKGVILLNIGLDAKEEVWRKTLGRVNIPGVNLWAVDEQKMRNLYYVNALPAYFIVNKKGQFAYLPEQQRDVVYEFEKLIKE